MQNLCWNHYLFLKPNSTKGVLLLCAFALSACGGDGGGDSMAQNTNDTTLLSNQPPTDVAFSIKEVSSDTITVTWGMARDDNTPANQLTYEVHISEGDNFTPSATTLKFTGQNLLTTQITGLKASTVYTVKLVAVDSQSLHTVSTSVRTMTHSVVVEKGLLNDTGITQCSNGNNVLGNCGSARFGYYQDAYVGRDALAAKGKLNKIGGGNGGFDFTKISTTGQILSSYESEWSCVQDNHSGLMWEIKTDDGGLRDTDNTYATWNSSFSFAEQVNSQGLCGYTNWRLPTVDELLSIVDYGNTKPSIDSSYFPRTSFGASYWSSSSASGGVNNAWIVNFYEGDVYDSERNGNAVKYSHYVRLVRSSQ